MKRSKIFTRAIMVAAGILAPLLHGGTLIEDRKYQPVVIAAWDSTGIEDKVARFPVFQGSPIANLHLYRYQASDGTWKMMPFQIDERTRCINPQNPSDTVWLYIIPPEWSGQAHDGYFWVLDELAFLIGDMGDQAPTDAWIDDAESRTQCRIELVVQDSLNPGKKAYAYLFRSSTITEPVPTPYQFTYDPALDQVQTKYYTLRHSDHGMIQDITIREPGGNGQDIFDMLKVRFAGVIDLVLPIPANLTENNFYLFPGEVYVTPNPVVRLVRQARQAAEIFSIVFEDTPFWLWTQYFPYSGTIASGASIYKADIEKMFPEAEITIVLRYTRQSWDLNENATGMKFYNAYNQAVQVDGNPDNVDKTVDIPVNAWSLLTGDQGSVFTHIILTEKNWDQVSLYYHDSKSGGQADSAQFGAYDTADNQSFGDNGVWVRNIGRDSLDMDLDLSAYFIPEQNLDAAGVQRIRDMALNPVNITSTAQTYESSGVLKSDRGIRGFQLLQNYPNPFNGETEIAFSLSRESDIRLTIVDARGRTIRTLVSGRIGAGDHLAVWNGKDDDRNPVASGIYLYQLKSDDGIQTRKLILSQ